MGQVDSTNHNNIKNTVFEKKNKHKFNGEYDTFSKNKKESKIL